MKKLKNFIAGVLMSCMVLSLFVPAFAAAAPGVPGTEPCDAVLTYDPTQTGGLISEKTRGAKAPTEMYNLDGKNYSVNGTFDTTIYTSYYFYPNADGELFYNFTFEWSVPKGAQVGVSVECWDKTDGKRVTENKFLLPENEDGSYGPIFNTGSWRIYNLNPTHQYYIRFTKSFDGFNAQVTGTISSKNWV